MSNLLQIAEKSNLPQEKKDYILAQLSVFDSFITAAEAMANKIVVENETQKEEMKQARELRLSLKEKRCTIENKRESLKKNLLQEGKTIDAVAKYFKEKIEVLEEYLEKQEKFVELREKAAKEKRAKEAEELLRKKEEEEAKIEVTRLQNVDTNRNFLFGNSFTWDGLKFNHVFGMKIAPDLLADDPQEFQVRVLEKLKEYEAAYKEAQAKKQEEEEKRKALVMLKSKMSQLLSSKGFVFSNLLNSWKKFEFQIPDSWTSSEDYKGEIENIITQSDKKTAKVSDRIKSLSNSGFTLSSVNYTRYGVIVHREQIENMTDDEFDKQFKLCFNISEQNRKDEERERKVKEFVSKLSILGFKQSGTSLKFEALTISIQEIGMIVDEEEQENTLGRLKVFVDNFNKEKAKKEKCASCNPLIIVKDELERIIEDMGIKKLNPAFTKSEIIDMFVIRIQKVINEL